MITDERRSYVRGNLDFKVQYKVITPEEYEDLKRFDKAIFSPFKNANSIDVSNTDIDAVNAANASLINYLVQMDAKLDRILELISTEKKVEASFRHGIGQNISGSGMQMVVDTPVELGKIIHSKFLLSQFPFIFMDIFGEVIREKEFKKDGTTLYRVGIKFLDLNITDREKIIAFVFQKQREAIRKSKSVAEN